MAINFLTGLVEQISNKTGEKLEIVEPTYRCMQDIVAASAWVFDTSAVYLQENRSIMDFFLPSFPMYGKKIIIPDAVLYEINLAKDSKPSLCKKDLKI